MDVHSAARSLSAKRVAPTSRPLEDVPYIDQFRSGEPGPAGDVAELFHENTKYTDELERKLTASSARLSADEFRWLQSQINPTYRHGPLRSLPDPADSLDRSLSRALRERASHRAFADAPLRAETLSTLLAHACGTSRTEKLAFDGLEDVRQRFRTYPSGGALYPVEVYLAIRNCADVDPGVYHYDHREHGLRLLDPAGESFDRTLSKTVMSPKSVVDVTEAGAMIVLTGAFWRSKAKYGPRGYRFVLQESGHVAQNLQLVGTALGLGSVPLGSFHDRRLNELLGLDGVTEAALYSLVFGPRTDGERDA
ncbi:SagB/ThcOx family dehydrogenase [Halovivax limisalsi]|uniref:SagB/ThcOx family dehydrogenase n=1 Tax=Halovivax limisalsi TaxID=1453760 RepID=UPI001FFC9E55|nr:SagB/ThcOx family dehydrogenase [Halovivax limisalsi]